MRDTRTRRVCLVVIGLVAALAAYGCGNKTYDPTPADWAKQTGQPTAPTAKAIATSVPSADPSQSVPALDVCKYASPDKVKGLYGIADAPAVNKATAPPIPGVDNLGSAYRCDYSWGQNDSGNRVSIVVFTKTGADGPRAFVEKYFGKACTTIAGLGDASCSSKQTQDGKENFTVVAAKVVEGGVAAVVVIVKGLGKDDKSTQLAGDVIAQVK